MLRHRNSTSKKTTVRSEEHAPASADRGMHVERLPYGQLEQVQELRSGYYHQCTPHQLLSGREKRIVCLLRNLSVCPSVCPPVCLSVCLAVFPSSCLPMRLPGCPSVGLPECLALDVSICLSACLSECLPVRPVNMFAYKPVARLTNDMSA